MSETDRVRRQREIAEMDREFQRKQREFREDFNQRRNEELQGLLERTNRIIRQIAEQEKYDLIVQEAVYFNPRIDMTERCCAHSTTPSSRWPPADCRCRT